MPKVPTFQEDMASIGRAGLKESCLKDNLLLNGLCDGPPRISTEEKIMRTRAVEWLHINEDKLLERGWSQAELYGAEGVFGIGWSRLWENDDLVVIVEDSGRISWSFTNSKKEKAIFYVWPNYVEIPVEEFDKF